MHKIVYFCPHCDSEDLLYDAFVAVNDSEDVRTFDDITCDNCGATGVRPDEECVEVAPSTQTNTEFVHDLMEYSRSGPLIQAFIIQALDEFSKRVAAGKPEDFDSPMVSGRAWHDCGVELQEKLKARLGA